MKNFHENNEVKTEKRRGRQFGGVFGSVGLRIAAVAGEISRQPDAAALLIQYQTGVEAAVWTACAAFLVSETRTSHLPEMSLRLLTPAVRGITVLPLPPHPPGFAF